MFITNIEIMLSFKALINSEEPDKFRIKALVVSTAHSPCVSVIAGLQLLEINAFML